MHAELARVGREPPQRRVAVLKGDGVGMLGREPIVDCQQRDAEVFDPAQRMVGAAEAIAEHHAAGVEQKDAGPRCSGRRTDDGGAEGRARHRDLDFLDPDIPAVEQFLSRRRSVGAAHKGYELPRYGRWKDATDDGERGAELRVERGVASLLRSGRVAHPLIVPEPPSTGISTAQLPFSLSEPECSSSSIRSVKKSRMLAARDLAARPARSSSRHRGRPVGKCASEPKPSRGALGCRNTAAAMFRSCC